MCRRGVVAEKLRYVRIREMRNKFEYSDYGMCIMCVLLKIKSYNIIHPDKPLLLLPA